MSKRSIYSLFSNYLFRGSDLCLETDTRGACLYQVKVALNPMRCKTERIRQLLYPSNWSWTSASSS